MIFRCCWERETKIEGRHNMVLKNNENFFESDRKA